MFSINSLKRVCEGSLANNRKGFHIARLYKTAELCQVLLWFLSLVNPLRVVLFCPGLTPDRNQTPHSALHPTAGWEREADEDLMSQKRKKIIIPMKEIEYAEQEMHNIVAHPTANLCPDSSQAVAPSQLSPGFMCWAWHLVVWNIPLAQCPGCVFQQLLPLQPSCCQSMRSWKVLALV